MTYVLDTNIIIHYLRKEPNVHQNIEEAVLQGDIMIVPNVVNYEMKRGFRVSSAPQKEKSYNLFVGDSGFCAFAFP